MLTIVIAPVRDVADKVRINVVVLGLAVLAGLSYGWRMSSDGLEPYYAAAVRSMAGNWHDFVYGAFDPDGRISLDKLPGAFWPQALSVRLFGVHVWAIALPQLIEGVVTVLVLYRVVRRLAGPVVGTLAAALVAAAPAVAALDRGNIPDSLLLMCLMCAADAGVCAARGGRWRSLVWVGVWVGLAFQAKMLLAWLIAPAFVLPFLLARPGPAATDGSDPSPPLAWSRVVWRVLLAGGVSVVVSLSWVLLVLLTPAAHRPYVDGSSGNSILEQVFGYNGVQRFTGSNPLLAEFGTRQAILSRPGPGVLRLLAGPYGIELAGLLPLAILLGVAVVASRRWDPLAGGALLFGWWLAVLAIGFSAANFTQPYYLASVAVPIAGLIGIGARWAVSVGHRGRWVAAFGVVGTLAYH
jgi:4-amino-4-deoxy-L-arabinose transferase-like glycosyltransferase